jgi:hypothetical protein
MEINAIRVTPYGIQLEDKTYRNTSKPVQKFLAGKLPATLEIIEEDNKGQITKVRVLNGYTPEPLVESGKSYGDKSEQIAEMSKLKNTVNARICALTNATSLAIAENGKDVKLELVMKYADVFQDYINKSA